MSNLKIKIIKPTVIQQISHFQTPNNTFIARNALRSETYPVVVTVSTF